MPDSDIQPQQPLAPEDPWYRQYWRRVNPRYYGCGCVLVLVGFAVFWVLLALVFPGLGLR